MNDPLAYDVAVIGGGVLGCFAARELTSYKIRTVLVEAASDVCTGITKANTAIVYPGYDHQPGSLKAEMTTAGNRAMEDLCRELEVEFSRPGSLMTASGPKGDRNLRKKMDQGLKNHLTGLELLSGEEARSLEPMLWQGITTALWCPSTGTVNPWRLGIAAFENAVKNGCSPLLNTTVRGITRDGDRYLLETDGGSIAVKMVLNCAGLSADQVREMLFPPLIRLMLDASDFLVFDKFAEKPDHILFQETEEKGKGITVVPCGEGNLLIESPARQLGKEFFATDRESLFRLKKQAADYLPGLDLTKVIRSFAAVRPNPQYVRQEKGLYIFEDKSIKTFAIDRPEPGFISLVGIKTPGLTCAHQLGLRLAAQAADFLGAEKNPDFDPHRKAILRPSALSEEERERLIVRDSSYGEIVCQCEEITRGEVLEAIRRGANHREAVRRRLGTGMGFCQGSRCSDRVEEIMKGVLHG